MTEDDLKKYLDRTKQPIIIIPDGDGWFSAILMADEKSLDICAHGIGAISIAKSCPIEAAKQAVERHLSDRGIRIED